MQRKEVGFVDHLVELKHRGLVKVWPFDQLAHFGNRGTRHDKAYGLNQLRYDLRKLKGHGLIERDGSRYAYRLTTKGVQIALLFLFFHKRLCGPLANSRFLHSKYATVAYLPAKTVYRLAAPSTPTEIVEQVATRAAAGEIMPDAAVKRLIDEKGETRRKERADAKLTSAQRRRKQDRKRQHRDAQARAEVRRQTAHEDGAR